MADDDGMDPVRHRACGKPVKMREMVQRPGAGPEWVLWCYRCRHKVMPAETTSTGGAMSVVMGHMAASLQAKAVAR